MLEIKRKIGESNTDYKIRVFIAKQCDDSITWKDVADILNTEFNTDYDREKYRSEWRRMDKKAILDPQVIEAKKEKIKAQMERTQVNATIRSQARNEYFGELALNIASKLSKERMLEIPKKIKIKENRKIGTLAIGDWHYGLEVSNYWNNFNPEICKERVSKLLKKTLKIIKDENITLLNIVNLGDMISGGIHQQLRINSRLDVATQVIEVEEILAEFLNELSKNVKIIYTAVSDNHSRFDANKDKEIRAEQFSRLIQNTLKIRFKENPNIIFNENTVCDDIGTFNIFEYKVGAVHGDRDTQKKIITNLNMYLQEHFDLLLTAHLHHFSANEENNTMFLAIGSLCGSDDFTEKLRLNSKPSQLMVISTKENVAEKIYKINL